MYNPLISPPFSDCSDISSDHLEEFMSPERDIFEGMESAVSVNHQSNNNEQMAEEERKEDG